MFPLLAKFRLRRIDHFPSVFNNDKSLVSQSLLICRTQRCSVATSTQQKTYIVKPLPLRQTKKRHIAIPVNSMPKKRYYQKKHTPFFTINVKKTVPKLLQVSAAILPLGSATAQYLAISNPLPLIWYSAWSLASFCFYGFDKYRASHDGWRLRENTLHMLDLLGGWPGGYLGQQYFHHKTQKRSFQVFFWATALLHNLLWFWSYTV